MTEETHLQPEPLSPHLSMPVMAEALELGPERRLAIEREVVDQAVLQLGHLRETRAKILAFFQPIILVAAINLLALIVVAFYNAVVAGKLLLIEVMIGAGIACLAIFFFRKIITDLLIEAEEVADVATQLTFVELASVREQLEKVSSKLSHEENASRISNALPELLISLGPVAMMLMQRETNVIRWGMLGWKVAQNAMTLFKERQHNLGK